MLSDNALLTVQRIVTHMSLPLFEIYFTGINVLHTMLKHFFGMLIDTDECDSNPCVNGGTCTDGLDLFTCACDAGFMGATCNGGEIIF